MPLNSPHLSSAPPSPTAPAPLSRWVMHGTISTTRAACCVTPNRDAPTGLDRREAQGSRSLRRSDGRHWAPPPLAFNGGSGCNLPVSLPPGQQQRPAGRFLFLGRRSAHAWSIDPVRQHVHLRCLHSGPLLCARTGRLEELSSLDLFSKDCMAVFKMYSKKQN